MNKSKDTLSTIVETAHKSSVSHRESDMTVEVKLHQVLKRLMDSHRVSVRAVAKACKIPPSTLASYLAGKKASYNPEHIACLADYFQVTTDFLLLEREEPTSALNSLQVEQLFEGWLRVKVERAIPARKKPDGGTKS